MKTNLIYETSDDNLGIVYENKEIDIMPDVSIRIEKIKNPNYIENPPIIENTEVEAPPVTILEYLYTLGLYITGGGVFPHAQYL